jgi:hypothetical protein
MGIWDNIKSFFGSGTPATGSDSRPPVIPLGTVAADNLVAWYKMDDNAASTVVLNEKGDAGTSVRNTNLMHVPGKIGGALSFDPDNNDYVDCNNSYQSTFDSNFTISLWAEPNDGNHDSTQNLICEIPPNDSFYLEFDDSGKLQFGYYVGEAEVIQDSNTGFSNGQETWHHIVITLEQVTASKVTLCFYFDGQSAGTYTNLSMVMSGYTNANNLRMGSRGGVEYFSGSLDDVRIYNKALTAGEILQLYNESKTIMQLSIAGENLFSMMGI